MNRVSFYFFRVLLLFWDILSLNLVLFIIAKNLHRANFFGDKDYLLYFLAFNLFWVGSAFVTALYIRKNWLDIQSFVIETIKSYFITLLFLLFFIFILKKDYSRLYIVLSIIGFGSALLLNRLLFYILIQSIKKNFKLRKNVIILGYNDISKKLIKYFSKETKLVNLLGCFDDESINKEGTEIKILGTLKQSIVYAKENNVTEIYSTVAPETHDFLYELAKDAENSFIHFKFVPDYRIFVNRNLFIDFVDDIPVLSLRKEPLENTGNKIQKRIFDIVFSFLIIVFILSWLIPLVGLLIKLESKGPIFFIQKRSGKSNQTFNCLKFRSLRVNDDANARQVTKNDGRITRLGKILRKTNIDELPQFLNVFVSDMSVVGPRPHMLKHTEDFTNIYKQYMIRHFIKPGVTGWAQINGYRGEIKDNEFLKKRVECDIWYMENWTILLDMKIVLMTIYTTFKGDKNAY